MPDPKLHMAELTLTESVAGAPVDIPAHLATQLILDDLVKGRVTYLVAFTFRGKTGRIWQLHNVDRVDDTIRALVQREKAEAIVVVHPTAVPPEVDAERCMLIAAESEGGKFDNLVAFKMGPQGEMFRMFRRAHTGEVRHRWFGVEPEVGVEMWIEGIVGAIGNKGEA